MCVTLITLLVVTLSPASVFPQQAVIKEKPEQIRLKNDLKHYQGMVGLYRQGNDDVVMELLTWDETRLAKVVGAINSNLDPNAPWSNDFLRSGALLQTAAGLAALDEGRISGMKFYFNLAAQHLRMGSAELEPFAGRWYFAAARIYRS